MLNRAVILLLRALKNRNSELGPFHVLVTRYNFRPPATRRLDQ